MAYFCTAPIGAICCRVEEQQSDAEDSRGSEGDTSESQRHRLYVMTLAVLPAYRGHGFGSQLLESVLDYIRTSEPIVHEIALHVQSTNTAAIQFYVDKFGFTQGELIENYYKDVDVPHCYKLSKKIDCRSEGESSGGEGSSSS